MLNRRDVLCWAPTLVLLAGCAAMPGHDPVRVQLAGLEPMQGEGLEIRFLCRLRVQNPNDTPVSFSGVSLELRVRGNPFASGVSDAAGTVPAFGETIVAVPVAVSALNMARVAFGMVLGNEPPRLNYVMSGKLGGGLFGTMRFESSGEVTLPGMSAGS